MLSIAVPADAYVIGGSIQGGMIVNVAMEGGTCVHTAALWRCDVTGTASPVRIGVVWHTCAPVVVRSMHNYVWAAAAQLPPTCIYLPEIQI